MSHWAHSINDLDCADSVTPREWWPITSSKMFLRVKSKNHCPLSVWILHVNAEDACKAHDDIQCNVLGQVLLMVLKISWNLKQRSEALKTFSSFHIPLQARKYQDSQLPLSPLPQNPVTKETLSSQMTYWSCGDLPRAAALVQNQDQNPSFLTQAHSSLHYSTHPRMVMKLRQEKMQPSV